MTGRRAVQAAARGLALSAAAAVMGCSRGDGGSSSASTTADADGSAAGRATSGASAGGGDHGREVFARTCVACHGERAEGTQLGPALAGAAAWKRATGGTADAVMQVIQAGVPDGDPLPMPGYAGALAPADLRAVSEYVASLHHP